MRSRSKKLTAILLSAALCFSFNTSAFAEEIGETGYEADLDTVMDAAGEEEEPYTGAEIDEEEGAAIVDEIGETGIEDYSGETDADSTAKPKNIAEALSGNVTIKLGTPYENVEPDFTISVNQVEKAIANELTFTVGTSTYYVLDDCLYQGKKGTGTLIGSRVHDYLNVSLNKIRNAGTKSTEGADLKYKDNEKKTITDVKGNQLVSFKATVDVSTNRAPHAKANTVEGEILLKTPYSGVVSEQRVPFANGKYALVVTYDAAVEYRGSRSVATSHYFVPSENKSSMGEVDGAVGVGARLEILSDNKVWYPIDKDGKLTNGYYWKDDTGITLKKPVCYNNKKVGSMYDEVGPYFTIKMSYKKKQGADELLTQDDKLSLKNALKNTRFHFTIEPRRLSTDLITYSKFEPDRFYIKKLTYNSSKNTLTGSIQYREQKKNKSTLNARSMKNVGKKLKIVSKTSYDSKPASKTDAYFVYDSATSSVTLTGINGYYGNAVISDKITVK